MSKRKMSSVAHQVKPTQKMGAFSRVLKNWDRCFSTSLVDSKVNTARRRTCSRSAWLVPSNESPAAAHPHTLRLPFKKRELGGRKGKSGEATGYCSHCGPVLFPYTLLDDARLSLSPQLILLL